MRVSRTTGWIAALIVALGLFSLFFSLLAERGRWPQLPPGALHNTDLAAGCVVALGLLWVLLREKKGDPAIERPAGPAPGEKPAGADGN
ncbi:MAG: hypothetical protein ABJC07_09525 [Acidobacteriota bacterium]